jgi:very-short-patch-repair endonuclease
MILDKSFSNNPKAKYWSDKNIIKPSNIYKSSHKKYWFNCDKCSHEFEIRLDKITNRNQWCSYCSSTKLCENEECKECFEKSFASHFKSKFWSNNNELNSRQVFKSSSTNKYWFNCDKCSHTFDCTTGNVSNGFWCPYCSNLKLCENKECKECFEKSFASHPKSNFFSKNNKIIPRNLLKNSNKKFWFDCENCNHQFDCNLSNITCLNRWCPYCCNPPKKLCYNDCKDCFNKSFASHPKSKFWSNKNEVIPRNVFISSGKKYLFKCQTCNNSFDSNLNNIVSGSWCPHCKHKTELKLFEWLKQLKYNVKKESSFIWSKGKRFDFILDQLKLIIELDGAQHFKQISNWQSPEKTQENDALKNKLANENGYRIIRICQEIVWNDTEDWKNQLNEAINKNNKIIKIGNVFKNKK